MSRPSLWPAAALPDGSARIDAVEPTEVVTELELRANEPFLRVAVGFVMTVVNLVVDRPGGFTGDPDVMEVGGDELLGLLEDVVDPAGVGEGLLRDVVELVLRVARPPGLGDRQPDRHDEGTNVVSVGTRAGFRFAYGPGSFSRHAAEAPAVTSPGSTSTTRACPPAGSTTSAAPDPARSSSAQIAARSPMAGPVPSAITVWRSRVTTAARVPALTRRWASIRRRWRACEARLSAV